MEQLDMFVKDRGDDGKHGTTSIGFGYISLLLKTCTQINSFLLTLRQKLETRFTATTRMGLMTLGILQETLILPIEKERQLTTASPSLHLR
jgi:hypothetical protein